MKKFETQLKVDSIELHTAIYKIAYTILKKKSASDNGGECFFELLKKINKEYMEKGISSTHDEVVNELYKSVILPNKINDDFDISKHWLEFYRCIDNYVNHGIRRQIKQAPLEYIENDTLYAFNISDFQTVENAEKIDKFLAICTKLLKKSIYIEIFPYYANGMSAAKAAEILNISKSAGVERYKNIRKILQTDEFYKFALDFFNL